LNLSETLSYFVKPLVPHPHHPPSPTNRPPASPFTDCMCSSVPSYSSSNSSRSLSTNSKPGCSATWARVWMGWVGTWLGGLGYGWQGGRGRQWHVEIELNRSKQIQRASAFGSVSVATTHQKQDTPKQHLHPAPQPQTQHRPTHLRHDLPDPPGPTRHHHLRRHPRPPPLRPAPPAHRLQRHSAGVKAAGRLPVPLHHHLLAAGLALEGGEGGGLLRVGLALVGCARGWGGEVEVDVGVVRRWRCCCCRCWRLLQRGAKKLLTAPSKTPF